MQAHHKPLSEIDDGDLVIVDLEHEPAFGIKTSAGDDHLVCALRPSFGKVIGPFLFVEHDDRRTVTLGSKWAIEFEPADITFEHGDFPPMGAGIISGEGIVIRCHGESGPCAVSVETGALVHAAKYQPCVLSWKILLHNGAGDHRDVFHWPIPDNEGNGD